MVVFKTILAGLSGARHMVRLAAVLALAACVQLPSAQDAEYNDAYGKRVLNAGFTLISDRYIDPISLHEIALSGMSGLHSLDPAFEVADNGNGARLSYANRPIGTINLPTSPFDSVRVLTATIAAELGETAVGSDHYRALFTLGIFLFIVTFLINLTADLVVRGIGRR